MVLAQGYLLLLHSKLEVFPTLRKSPMLFKSSLDKTINHRKLSPLHAGFSDWPYSSFLSLISVTTEIPKECTGEMILHWFWMCTSYSLAGLLSFFISIML